MSRKTRKVRSLAQCHPGVQPSKNGCLPVEVLNKAASVKGIGVKENVMVDLAKHLGVVPENQNRCAFVRVCVCVCAILPACVGGVWVCPISCAWVHASSHAGQRAQTVEPSGVVEAASASV